MTLFLEPEKREMNRVKVIQVPPPPKRFLWRHDALPVSSNVVLIRLLDSLDVRECQHCEDLRFAIIAFIKGLSPLASVPDETVVLHDAKGSKRRHLVPGVTA